MGAVAANNMTFDMSAFESASETLYYLKIMADDWKNKCRHTMKFQMEFMGYKKLLKHTTESFIINLSTEPNDEQDPPNHMYTTEQ